MQNLFIGCVDGSPQKKWLAKQLKFGKEMGREEAFMGRTNGFLREQTGEEKICDDVCLCKRKWSFLSFSWL